MKEVHRDLGNVALGKRYRKQMCVHIKDCGGKGCIWWELKGCFWKNNDLEQTRELIDTDVKAKFRK